MMEMEKLRTESDTFALVLSSPLLCLSPEHVSPADCVDGLWGEPAQLSIKCHTFV